MSCSANLKSCNRSYGWLYLCVVTYFRFLKCPIGSWIFWKIQSDQKRSTKNIILWWAHDEHWRKHGLKRLLSGLFLIHFALLHMKNKNYIFGRPFLVWLNCSVCGQIQLPIGLKTYFFLFYAPENFLLVLSAHNSCLIDFKNVKYYLAGLDFIHTVNV